MGGYYNYDNAFYNPKEEGLVLVRGWKSIYYNFFGNFGTLAFLVFNKLNSVYELLATSWALTTPGRAASERKCWYFCKPFNF